ncbi:putative disease resistance protein RGA1 isoform X2 [Arachis stenosperma]|uniref:putative disease resistance protein RGA1 isoform X2 n=1 Tax=Arachis stenosperma TaxID=217475 RepID=UPI0025ACB165|nr:putative disease resistance protein RGA1 isoform X2 [Arachis stenosperma]
MAESFIFSIADSLTSKLASRAYGEASRVVGVYDDLQDLKTSLSYVKAVLLDAEQKQKQEQSHELREWLKQIKLVFYDAENLLDQVDCETLRKQVIRDYGTPKDKVGRFFSSSNPLVFRYKLAHQIKEIKKRLDKVAADRDKFGLQVIDVDRRVVHKREMTYSHVVESDVIGRAHDKKKIIKLLMEPILDNNAGYKHISVIPIVGFGGLGKTTLAKLVFNDKRVTKSFPLKRWVSVSDDFNIKSLILKIINPLSDFASSTGQQNLRDLEIEQLQHRLRNVLEGKKFLLVLDDVWNEDRVKWVELQHLISVGAQGSKVIVTTRSQSIASMMGTVAYSHHLKGLSPKNSLRLFVRWAFKEGEEGKYPDLIEIGREILKKCKGVPLAVRTLGSSLFSKHEIQEWESLRDKEIWNLPQKEDDILPALKLSYDEMPSHLRQCFALLSLYPRNFRFDSFGVASLWGAAGLLPLQSKDKTMVDVAHQYLRDLMARSFLHDVSDCGTFYFFGIHDLVHDLAVYVAKDVCQLVSSNTQDISENVLHLSFVENGLPYNSVKPSLRGTRSILFPVDEVGASEAFLNAWVLNCTYLRYLDLSNSTCETLPESIGCYELEVLPEWLSNLSSLKFLFMGGCPKLKSLPSDIHRLTSLQVLRIINCTELYRKYEPQVGECWPMISHIKHTDIRK